MIEVTDRITQKKDITGMLRAHPASAFTRA